MGRKDNSFVSKRSKRVLKGRCACRNKHSKLKCFELDKKDREALFKKFWELNWKEKHLFICARVVREQKKRRARNRKNDEFSRRTCSYKYLLDKGTLQRVRVCKAMFCATLGISPRTVTSWLDKELCNNDKSQNEKEEVTKTGNGRKLRNEKAKESLKELLKSIAKLESNYCRKSTSKLYLQPQFKTKRALYDLYKGDWCRTKNEEPVSIATFIHIFEEMNLCLFVPKKDECNTCVAYQTKNIGEEEYQTHIEKKEQARREKEKDKNSANRDTMYVLNKNT